jgi:hypothetical protein
MELSAPADSVKSNVAAWPTVSVKDEILCVLKLDAVASSVYCPGVMLTMPKDPAPFEVVVVSTDVLKFRSFTDAFATTAPVESCTEPLIDAEES